MTGQDRTAPVVDEATAWPSPAMTACYARSMKVLYAILVIGMIFAVVVVLFMLSAGAGQT